MAGDAAEDSGNQEYDEAGAGHCNNKMKVSLM